MNENIKLGKKLTINYAVLQSFFWMSGCCVMCFASVFLLSRGFTNSQVGITLALASCMSIVCQPLIASFADRTTKLTLRALLACMLGLGGILTLLLMLLPPLFLPTAILFLIISSLTRMQQSFYTALAMEHMSNGTPLNFSLARGIGSFAFAISSFSLGFLIDDFGGGILLPINLCAIIVSIILVSLFPRPKKSKKDSSGEKASGLLKFAAKNKRFMVVLLGLVLMYFSHILINTYTIQIVKSIGGSSSDMGLASAIGGLVELPAMALFPFVLRKVKSASTIMKISGIFFVLKSILTLLAPNVFFFYIAQSMQFFAFAMLLPACVYYVNRTILGADSVKGQSSMDLTMSLSGIAGNLLGGVFLDISGVPFMLTVGIIVSLIGVVILFFAAEKDKAPTAPDL